MRKITFLILLLTTFTLNSFAQDEMKKWMDYMTPGKEHQDLAKMNGEWTFKSKMWMDPSAPPVESEGTAVYEMILGGRYSLSKVYSNVMNMPMEGLNIVGYDNAKKVWVSTWIDNLGTGISFAEGTYDAINKYINFIGTMVDPITGKDTKFRETFKITSDKTFEIEMFSFSDGKEFKNMEMKFTKK